MSLVDNSSQIYLHFGTYDGSIFGFEGNLTSLKNLYGFTSNLVNLFSTNDYNLKI